MLVYERQRYAALVTAAKISRSTTSIILVVELDCKDERKFVITSDEDWLDSSDCIAYNGRVVAEFFEGIEE